LARTAAIAVVGLGAAGSAILEALARRGVAATGFDQFHPPHPLGSTHGRSRIIREAYYESPVYVPLVQRAYQEWERLERESGRHLLTRTGGIMIGQPESELVQGARMSAEHHGLPHEVIGAREIRRRFPVFAVGDGDVGVVEPRAGFLDPEQSVRACLELATRAGARVETGVRVTGWSRSGGGIRLETSGGTLECGRVVLAAGPWLPDLLGHHSLPLTIERQVMFWFTPRQTPARFAARQCPVFIWEHAKGRMFYGIPDHGFGFKAAIHHEGRVCTPETVDREVSDDEVAQVRELLARTIPDAPGDLRESAVCLYTNTPDQHFVLGPHPNEPAVYLVSPCSGHGFKFASAVGAVVAQTITGENSGLDLLPFAPQRLMANG
jgi:sarcosine oxidase